MADDWANKSDGKRFREVLSELKKDHKGRYKTVDVLRLLRRECELVEMLSKGRTK
jgi:hypothetical protein